MFSGVLTRLQLNDWVIIVINCNYLVFHRCLTLILVVIGVFHLKYRNFALIDKFYTNMGDAINLFSSLNIINIVMLRKFGHFYAVRHHPLHRTDHRLVNQLALYL